MGPWSRLRVRVQIAQGTPDASRSTNEGTNMALWRAARDGNLEEAKRLLSEQSADVDFTVLASDEEAFQYKSRTFSTQPIHVAAASDQSIAVLRLLLEKRASVDAEAINDPKEKGKRVMQPIHIAAGRGSIRALEVLIEHGAQPNAWVQLDGKNYYLPIHDAVWHNQARCASFLIEKNGELGRENSEGNTALHIAAKLGYADLVEQLTNDEHCSKPQAFHPADHALRGSERSECQMLLEKKNKEKKSPFELALESDWFPAGRLNMFTKHMDEEEKGRALVQIAQRCPSAASKLLRTPSTLEGENEGIDPEWKRCLRLSAKSGNLDGAALAMLIADASQVAIDVITLCSVVPKVCDAQHNALPVRAVIRSDSHEPCPSMSCDYVEDDEWRWDETGDLAWQKKLAPKDPKKGKEVLVRVLLIRGALNLQVAHNLAESEEDHIFSKLVIHALIKHMWLQLRWMFYVDLAHQVLVVVLVSIWSRGCCRPESRLARHALWCVLSSQGTTELVMLVATIWSCCSQLGWLQLRQWLKRRWRRLCITSCTITLAWTTASDSWPDDETPKWVLSVNVLLHWLFVLYELRVSGPFSRRLLPILNSVQPIAGMVPIMFVLVAAFLHAFWAVDPESASIDILTLLFTGEGFIDSSELRAMDDSDSRLTFILICLTMFIFTACALNVFIAVINDSYDQERDNLTATFLRVRAGVCRGLLLRPGLDVWQSPKEDRRSSAHAQPTTQLSLTTTDSLASGSGLLASPSGGAMPAEVEKDARLACWYCLIEGLHSWLSVVDPRVLRLFIIGSILCLTSFLLIFLLQEWIPTACATAAMVLIQAAIKSYRTNGWERRHLWLCHERDIDEDMVQTNGKFANIRRQIYEQKRSQALFQQELFKRTHSMPLSPEEACRLQRELTEAGHWPEFGQPEISEVQKSGSVQPKISEEFQNSGSVHPKISEEMDKLGSAQQRISEAEMKAFRHSSSGHKQNGLESTTEQAAEASGHNPTPSGSSTSLPPSCYNTERLVELERSMCEVKVELRETRKVLEELTGMQSTVARLGCIIDKAEERRAKRRP